MGRGRSWTTTENVKLCRCWLQISEDAVVSDSQKSGEFYSKVTNLFLEGQEDPDRPDSAVHRQWKKIQAAVSKFCGLFSKIIAMNESGLTFEDRIVHTESLWKKIEEEEWRKNNPGKEPDNKIFSFKYRSCWEVLKDSPKWNLQVPISTPSRKTPKKSRKAEELEILSSSEEEGSDVAVENCRKIARPSGCKKARGQMNLAAVAYREVQVKEKLAATQEALVAQKAAHVKAIEKAANVALFKLPGTDPELLAKYRDVMQRLAIAEAEAALRKVEDN